MPELLNNTLETELLEGFMHQLNSEETEKKLSHLFARTVVDMLTLRPDGRAFSSDIFDLCSWRNVCNEWSSLQGPSQGLLLPTGSLWGAAQHWISASVSTLFFPQGFPSTWDWRHLHKRRQALLSSRMFWCSKLSSRSHTEHEAPGSEKKMRQPIHVFKGKTLLCWEA